MCLKYVIIFWSHQKPITPAHPLNTPRNNPALPSYPEPPHRYPDPTALPVHVKVSVSGLYTGTLSGVTVGGVPMCPWYLTPLASAGSLLLFFLEITWQIEEIGCLSCHYWLRIHSPWFNPLRMTLKTTLPLKGCPCPGRENTGPEDPVLLLTVCWWCVVLSWCSIDWLLNWVSFSGPGWDEEIISHTVHLLKSYQNKQWRKISLGNIISRIISWVCS